MSFVDCAGNAGRCRLAVAGMVSLWMLAQPARADMLELTNGDHYRGTVVSMTPTTLEFISEVQGRVTLPRSKIAQITLHEVTPKPVAVKPATNAPLVLSGTNSAPTPTPTANAPTPAPSSTDVVILQMRQQGVDPKIIAQVQEQILKGNPEASSKFNELMSGLMTGQVSIKDIRDQAQRGIDQIKAAKKELGPDAGELLDGYLAILQNFVQESASETTPPVSQSTPPAPTPGK